VRITPERLRQVDDFEDGLRALGFVQLRVRYHEAVARLELDEADLERALTLRKAIVELGLKVGFRYVALDLSGFRSGSLNDESLVPLKRSSS
jgi:uncharacterized protein